MKTTLVRFFRIAVAALAATVLAGPLPARALPAICFVDVDATGAENGKTWTDAWTNLHPALSATGCEEIWVAEGVYVPSTTVAGTTYLIARQVGVYGGFDATEDQREERDWVQHVTILSGDMTGNDTNTDGNHIAETTADIQGTNIDGHVVTIRGNLEAITSATVLDGFTITAGDANEGGGMYLKADGGEQLSPSLSHLTFSGNRAVNGGGALYITAINYYAETLPALVDVTFHGNHGDYGGAVASYAFDAVSSPSLKNVTFSNNSADMFGGGFTSWATGEATASPVLANVTFFGNAAGTEGGGMAAICTFAGIDPTCEPMLLNVTFSGNTAVITGGGLLGGGNSADAQLMTLINVILWGNSAPTGGDLRNFSYLASVIGNSVIRGSGGSGASWDDDLGIDKGGNVDKDPMLAPLANNGGYTQTMALRPRSSAIDGGYDTTCEDIYVNKQDQRGIVRPQREHCDIGAYEADRYGIAGNAGAVGATLSYTDVVLKSVVSDSTGEYYFTVPPDWTGNVTPSKGEMVFSPDHREYTNLMEDQPDQDYEAVQQTPTIVEEFPADGSTTCRKPLVGVDLQLADLVRNDEGMLDVDAIALVLDGVDRTLSATIMHDSLVPASGANIVYNPPSNLSASLHHASFVYPSPSGLVTFNWSFTAAAGTCPTMASAQALAMNDQAPATAEALAAVVAPSPAATSSAALQSAYRRLMLKR